MQGNQSAIFELKEFVYKEFNIETIYNSKKKKMKLAVAVISKRLSQISQITIVILQKSILFQIIVCIDEILSYSISENL